MFDLVAAMASSPWMITCVLPAVPLYLILCSSLRFRREKAMRRKFNYPTRKSMSGMTNDDAQGILQYVMQYEFPRLYVLSLQFALFKTYAVPAGSKLLVATKNLADPDNVSKRYEDTVVLIGEFSSHPPTSERTLRAIARMNYLHGIYKKKGLIKNATFLYVLSVFITTPEQFMRLYEWRSLNEMEVCAIATFWKGIGDAMGIDYEPLERNGGGWEDGIEFYEDIAKWAKAYEIEMMVPHAANRATADTLVPMLVYYVPGFMKAFAVEVTHVLMGDRVRDAFMFPEPGIAAGLAAYLALNVRRFAMRFLALPRFRPVKAFSDPDPKTGRIYHREYQVDPFYNKPTFWSRWGPTALLIKMMGGGVPSSANKHFFPQGYLLEEIGPVSKIGMGQEEMKEELDTLVKERTGGCPFF
ncbi:hypothetical protein MKZ38_000333 [Zalerion maritima]|uniref:ER-bound oxygenase mpaB/mpaB'/Rubber oxygenase catalytic domain-containing protein n=1 Tax=Zalerion maritima TaxID=339359 RepID=A0AAD5RRJ5_9PEZI|nr:hypothetical protein MKZ38_000333 [Zalerion maritima]